jgi:methyltransferase (TIGR00027 family)
MREGRPSLTAQLIAAHRLGFERVSVPYGDPSADEALARDVAGETRPAANEWMRHYLRVRTAFFDRVVVDAIDRGDRQIVLIGAGYDGRPLRYSREGVSWWEIDHPDTQADKRGRMVRLGLPASAITFLPHDLETQGFAAALAESGFDGGSPSLLCCEGVAAYLTPHALDQLLGELRAIAASGTRLVISLSVATPSAGAAERRRKLHARLATFGEPVVSTLGPEEAHQLFARTGWRRAGASSRSESSGLVIVRPGC